MTSEEHGHGHGPENLCETGTELYERALDEGFVHRTDAASAPCLMDVGLLQPSVEDPNRLEPVAPAVVLHRLLRRSEDRIAQERRREERRREERLTEVFEPLMRLEGRRTAGASPSAVEVISGTRQINQAITRAMVDATEELLAIQPRANYTNRRGEPTQAVSMARDQALLDRGGRIRTLYQHTTRHLPLVLARYEQLRGDAEARTLDELTDRMIIVDRAVAFIPAHENSTLALEVRHPALVGYFATTFDRLWHLATPMYPQAVRLQAINGVSPRQRAIAHLLVEGHTDTAIADRLGLNVRTARLHIAKLATQLGSESRAQLGYLIGRSGILERESEQRP